MALEPFSYAGITQIRFKGWQSIFVCPLSPATRAPRVLQNVLATLAKQHSAYHKFYKQEGSCQITRTIHTDQSLRLHAEAARMRLFQIESNAQVRRN